MIKYNMDPTAPLHVDMRFGRPTVWADDQAVVKDGRIAV